MSTAHLAAISALRHLEEKTGTRMRDFMVAARTLLEGNRGESLAAVNRITDSGFRDPEGLFYLARHLARLSEKDEALKLLRSVVAGGFFCYPALVGDPWLEPLRASPGFAKLLRQAEARHHEAAAAFARLQGDSLVGLSPVATPRETKSVGLT